MGRKVPDQLPDFLKPFFWEINFADLRLPERQFYVIERLLEYGDDQAIRWVKTTFSRDTISYVVRNSRCISRNTANLWALILNIPREAIRCFSTLSLLPQGSFSNN